MMEGIFNLTAEQELRVEEEVGTLRFVTEFCSELLESAKELPLKERLAKLLPWAVKSGEIVREVVPFAAVLVKLVDEVIKEKDPEKLGLLACSLAYQRSSGLALAQQGEPTKRVPFERSLQSAREDLKKLNVMVSLTGFTLEAPLANPFVWQADDCLSLVVRSRGYSDSEWRQIQLRVHDQFRADLVEVLSHGETAAQFKPFTTRLSLSDTTPAYAALNAHIERQRWLFENRPVLNVEPFTLDDVYVDIDCGKLQWKDFPAGSKRDAPGERFDAFSEEFGGRHPLLETVLDYLRDPRFNDAIVIEGAPGCGKSSFTLRLANVLRREGLRPLRVRLKFLDLYKDLSGALAQVVLQPEEYEDPALASLSRCSDPFLGDSIFDERTKFGDAEICPYILILDGWDEISVAVNEGFEIEVGRMLDNVRRQFLRPRTPRLRVLLTGRPSHAIERSQFLRNDTPVLTIRDYTPDQLQTYAGKVRSALDHCTGAVAQTWPVSKWDNVTSVVTSYRKNKSKLEILGLPLLAHLSLRLLAQWSGGPESLLSDRTALYRHLLDFTCPKSGKDSSDHDDLGGQARISGFELRRMLQQTAVAITAYGSESIPFRELQLRLKKSRKQTMEAAECASKEHPFTRLMISFYFKGGREHLGCEFLHKSFREYLFAEAIVETVKEYVRKQNNVGARREPYWRDFQESDLRRQFSRDLSQSLCSYPLTSEIRAHLRNLLAWEIGRFHDKPTESQIGQSLEAVTFAQWKIIRDSLGDLWEWWGEGVHLRPQRYRDDSDHIRYYPAFVNELIDYSLPRDRGLDAPEWGPSRLVNADANLGDALCQLNAWVHASMLQLESNGILPKAEGRVSSGGSQLQRGQMIQRNATSGMSVDQHRSRSEYQSSRAAFMLFRPSGSSPLYFQNYCSRINASGNRSFPGPVELPWIDLSQADLHGMNFSGANLSGADLHESILHGASLSEADLHGADLTGADLRGADLDGANLHGACLQMADLRGANLSRADLGDADLRGAYRHMADFRGTNLKGAKLSRAVNRTDHK